MGMNVALSQVRQINYTSYDPINKRTFYTPATIMVPQSKPIWYNGVNPILIYAMSYDSVAKECGPSYRIASGTFTTQERTLMTQALNAGITVVLPDYEGPMGAFEIGPISGNAILDVMRGVLNTPSVVPNKSQVRFVLKGYSGGATAVSWALQQQAAYAPELLQYIKGAAIGGLSSDAGASLKKLNGGAFSTLVVTAVAAYSNNFPTFRTWVAANINAAGRAAMTGIAQICPVDRIQSYQNVDIFQRFFGMTTAQAMNSTALAPILSSLVVASGNDFPVPQVPIYIYSSQQDEIIPFSQSQRYVNSLCARGINSLEFGKIPFGTHVSTEILIGSTSAFTFIQARFGQLIPPAYKCLMT